jgi:hypothetical protein
MPISTEYFSQLSHVRMSGKITTQEVFGSIVSNNQRKEFRDIKIRLVDGRDIEAVNFNIDDMGSFVAVDKSSFIQNEGLTVIVLSHNEQFNAFFDAYVTRMRSTPWTFHRAESIEQARNICDALNVTFPDNID